MEEGWKDCRSQRIKESAVRLCALITPESMSIKSPTNMTAQCELNKDDTSEYVKLDGEKPTGPQPLPKNYSQLRKAGSERHPTVCLVPNSHP